MPLRQQMGCTSCDVPTYRPGPCDACREKIANGYCPLCGGGLEDPEPWHAHDRPPSCDTCDFKPWPETDPLFA